MAVVWVLVPHIVAFADITRSSPCLFDPRSKAQTCCRFSNSSLMGDLMQFAGIVVSLLQSQVHQVFVVRSCHVATDEDDDVGQYLEGREITM